MAGRIESMLPSQTSTFIEAGAELEEELRRDEARIEAYGADDPREPPLKASPGSAPNMAEASAKDANLVVWDGDNDAENPQNWSRSYKWFVTMVCSLMTVNVYVPYFVARRDAG
jgi:DHA1 family multidrug resistance protein-like MFS transporter